MSIPIHEPLEERPPEERKKASTLSGLLPWPLVLLAAVPVTLATIYLTSVDPSRLAALSAVDVPLPAATRFLGEVCDWCGKNPFLVVLIGVSLLLGGLVSNLLAARYYVSLAIVVTLGLGFTYYTVSAPIDRFIDSVKESLPEDRGVKGAR